MKLTEYQANGFRCLTPLAENGLRSYPVTASTTIVKGDIVTISSGYATTATAMAAAVVGVAAEDADNSAGAAGAIDVKVYPIDAGYQFSVPVSTNAVIARANVGTIVDLEANDDIDLSDTTIAAGPGFYIDDFDASAAAVAANTYGYAIGHFHYVS